MGHCKDCKHFAANHEFASAPKGFGECMKLGTSDDSLLIALDRETIMVRPEFGCIEFEPKP